MSIADLTFFKKFDKIKGADISVYPLDLAPSISTFKVCGVSLPYLICIAGLALSDLIGLTRLSWVSLLVLPNLCGERALATAEGVLSLPLDIIIITHSVLFVKCFLGKSFSSICTSFRTKICWNCLLTKIPALAPVRGRSVWWVS